MVLLGLADEAEAAHQEVIICDAEFVPCLLPIQSFRWMSQKRDHAQSLFDAIPLFGQAYRVLRVDDYTEGLLHDAEVAGIAEHYRLIMFPSALL
ncbi:hypothetical protein D3C78_1102710 [compost metagenome]